MKRVIVLTIALAVGSSISMAQSSGSDQSGAGQSGSSSSGSMSGSTSGQSTSGSSDQGGMSGQSGSTSGSGQSGSSSGSMSGQSDQGGMSGSGQSASGRQGSQLSRQDANFVSKAAQSGLLEVQLGQLAQQKGSSEQVKQFGQQMVQDHEKANQQLMSIAQQVGATAPATLDRKHQRMIDKLSKLEGQEFDREFMQQQVKIHQQNVQDFQKQAENGQDPNLKSYAQQTLPALQHHLQMAQSAASQNKGDNASASQ